MDIRTGKWDPVGSHTPGCACQVFVCLNVKVITWKAGQDFPDYRQAQDWGGNKPPFSEIPMRTPSPISTGLTATPQLQAGVPATGPSIGWVWPITAVARAGRILLFRASACPAKPGPQACGRSGSGGGREWTRRELGSAPANTQLQAFLAPPLGDADRSGTA